MSSKTRLLFRWGVWMCYSEWEKDQPKEDWSGSLDIRDGDLQNPQLVMYYGWAGPTRRTFVPLDEPCWKSRTKYARPMFGYQGLEGLLVDVRGGKDTQIVFTSGVLGVKFNMGDIPAGGKLTWPVGSKYSCSELVVCRIEDEGEYWDQQRVSALISKDQRSRKIFKTGDFDGDFITRDIHHQLGSWVPPGGTLAIPFGWEEENAIVTWHFTGSYFAPVSESYPATGMFEYIPPKLHFETKLDGKKLGEFRYIAKFIRAACTGLEHTDLLEGVSGQHLLEITNLSDYGNYPLEYGIYLVLTCVSLEQKPVNWLSQKKCLPFRIPELDEFEQSEEEDFYAGPRGVMVGYETNTLEAENGWFDSLLQYMAITGNGNYVFFRVEQDKVTEAVWKRWFEFCGKQHIYFTVGMTSTAWSVDFHLICELAKKHAAKYFIGVLQHEPTSFIYKGWSESQITSVSDIKEAEAVFIQQVNKAYDPWPDNVPKVLGEGALTHKYGYKSKADIIQTETMVNNTSLMFAEARGAATANGRKFWGAHIANHVHCLPENRWHQRMRWLNLYMGYLSGVSLFEEGEESALGQVHSFVTGPSDPMPLDSQKKISQFFKWARANPRPSRLQVDVGFLYGRHDLITGGMSLNKKRPVRVWEGIGKHNSFWDYSDPEYGWLLIDLFLPGVWLCPILRDDDRLRRWFAGTPYGQVDVIDLEAKEGCFDSYKMLVLPGWNTMSNDDMKKFIRYVQQGGTLVMALPQLQTSTDREKVLSTYKFDFVDPDLIDGLCGLQIAGAGKRCSSIDAMSEHWQMADDENKNLRLMEVKLTSGTSVFDSQGSPVLVENRLGKGRVFTWSTMDYMGHKGLRKLVRKWLEKTTNELPFDIRLEGGDNEVASYIYQMKDGRKRVYLINTDWTVAGNIKKCKLISAKGQSVEVDVKEGQLSEVIL